MSATLRFTADVAFIRFGALIGIATGIFCYIIRGHALICGPHLFLLPFIDIFCRDNDTNSEDP